MSKRTPKSFLTKSDFDRPWHETPKFKALNKKWHDKLEKSGFKDIEEFESPLELLKANDNIRFINIHKEGKFLDRQRYYELAGQKVYSYPFDTEKDQKIWQMHAEGKSEKLIQSTLKATDHQIRKTIKEVRESIKKDSSVRKEEE